MQSCAALASEGREAAWFAWLAPLELAAKLPLHSLKIVFQSSEDGFDVQALRQAVAKAQAHNGGGGITVVAARTAYSNYNLSHI